MANETEKQLRTDDTGNGNKANDSKAVNNSNQTSTDDGVKDSQQRDTSVLSDEDRNKELARQEEEIKIYYENTYGKGASREYCEAAEELDPTDPQLQAGEFWQFHDKELEEHGNF